MVALAVRQSKKTLLENRVATVPEGQAKYEKLITVAEACDGILAPAISFASRQVVSEKIPRRTVGAVVFAYGAP
jgi:hypothetical protein